MWAHNLARFGHSGDKFAHITFINNHLSRNHYKQNQCVVNLLLLDSADCLLGMVLLQYPHPLINQRDLKNNFWDLICLAKLHANLYTVYKNSWTNLFNAAIYVELVAPVVWSILISSLSHGITTFGWKKLPMC